MKRKYYANNFVTFEGICNMLTVKKLQLNDSLIIGNGGVRTVYQHPHDKHKCIKITYNHLRNRSVRREILYLFLYHLRKKPFIHLPRFYSLCNTNLGRGAIFDLFYDYDFNRSKMLSEHLENLDASPLSPREIVFLLDELLDHLLQNGIIICDPAPSNLLVHNYAPDCRRLVIVDGIGNPHFIKIADLSTKYAHRLISKKWQTYVETNPLLKTVFTATGYTPRSV